MESEPPQWPWWPQLPPQPPSESPLHQTPQGGYQTRPPPSTTLTFRVPSEIPPKLLLWYYPPVKTLLFWKNLLNTVNLEAGSCLSISNSNFGPHETSMWTNLKFMPFFLPKTWRWNFPGITGTGSTGSYSQISPHFIAKATGTDSSGSV